MRIRRTSSYICKTGIEELSAQQCGDNSITFQITQDNGDTLEVVMSEEDAKFFAKEVMELCPKDGVFYTKDLKSSVECLK